MTMIATTNDSKIETFFQVGKLIRALEQELIAKKRPDFFNAYPAHLPRYKILYQILDYGFPLVPKTKNSLMLAIEKNFNNVTGNADATEAQFSLLTCYMAYMRLFGSNDVIQYERGQQPIRLPFRADLCGQVCTAQLYRHKQSLTQDPVLAVDISEDKKKVVFKIRGSKKKIIFDYGHATIPNGVKIKVPNESWRLWEE